MPASPAAPRRRNALRVPGRTLAALAAVGAAVILVWLGARGALWPPREPRVVVLYCYSALDDVMEQGMLPLFRGHWEESTGEQLEFVTTYAGSGDITNLILKHYPADIAILSSPLDAYRLANVEIRWESWKTLPDQGIVGRTPMVILVREGNPKKIRDFADLAAPGVEVIHPDPRTSGAGTWGILAVYGSVLRRTGDRQAAEAAVAGLWKNVVEPAGSARQARRLFASGRGDALVTYEQDLLATPSRWEATGEIVYPESTILTTNTVAVIDKNIDERQRAVVNAFLEFLWTDAAQRLFVDYGFQGPDRDANAATHPRPPIPDLFELPNLGDATTIRREILEQVWRRQVETAD